MLKGLGNVFQLMKNAGQIRGKMAELQEQLAKLHVEGTAGAGMVTVTANGHQKVLTVSIEPSLIASGDREMIEELVAAATNQALDKARSAAAEQMQEMAGGLELPGLGEALSKMGLGGGPEE